MMRLGSPGAILASMLVMTIPSGMLGQDPVHAPVTVSATANHGISAACEQGWPLLVTVHLLHAETDEDTLTSVTITGGGSWGSAVEIVVTDSTGGTVSWPFHPAASPAGDLVLDADSGGALGWWLTPEETAVIAPGAYRLVAKLDSTAVAPPFAGRKIATSVPVRIAITAPTSGNRLLAADYHVLRGEDSLALVELDQLIATDTANMTALAYRARLLRLMGRLPEAMASYAAAVDAYFTFSPDSGELPFTILGEYYDLQALNSLCTLFKVTVGLKTPYHPAYQDGYADGFLIDGIEGAELWLLEDSTYTFRLSAVPGSTPFYFTGDSSGNGAAPYTDGVTGSPATDSGEITIAPGPGTPRLLYYQSTTQPKMGWRLHIMANGVVTATDPAERTMPREYELGLAYPNPFNPETRFTLTTKREQRVVVTMYDSRGGKVLTIFDDRVAPYSERAFAVNGRGLASGAYLIRIQGEYFSASRRIVLLK